MHDESLPFGSWLREYRTRRDLTRRELAQLIGCSVETVRKLESGERRPSKQIAALVAEQLELSAEERRAFVEYARARPAQAAAPGQSVEDHERSDFQRGVAAPPSNLRKPLTTLIGRGHEVAVARHYLRETPTRLLTFVGPPGVGKTRLAIEVALDLLPDYPGGVYFVPLAQVADPSLVLDAIVRTTGPGNITEPLLPQRLAEQLRGKQMLLLLDNFEQIVDAAPGVEELLEECPDLGVIVTSREPLHLPGEQQLHVPPLALPDPSGQLKAVVVSRSPAVILFVERARAVERAFALTDDNALFVAAICTQLDGLPLAIELVAARVKMLSPQALLERMLAGRDTHAPLNLSAGHPHSLPARQRTLRDAIGWSYELLSEQERRLFARLSVFSGGCTLLAIEAVCNPKGDLGSTAFDLAASLLDKNLLRRSDLLRGTDQNSQPGENEPRVAMLEMVREFAAERLVERGETQSTRRLHSEYYLALAQAADPHLTGAEQKLWLDRLEQDHDNLLSALQWLLDQGDVQTAAQLGVSLKRFWEVHNHFAEGRRWLKRILAAPEEIAPDLRARALNAAGVLAIGQNDYEQALSLLYSSLQLQRQLGDDTGIASALNNLGLVALSAGRKEEALPLFEEGIELLRKLGDRARTATALGNFAVAVSETGNFGRAAQLLRESLELRRQLGNRWGVAAALGNLAEVLRAQGSFDEASNTYRETILLMRELGDRVGVAKALIGFAAISKVEGQHERALKLLAASQALLHSAGGGLGVTDQEEQRKLVAETRAALDEDVAASKWESGLGLSIDEAISYALQE